MPLPVPLPLYGDEIPAARFRRLANDTCDPWVQVMLLELAEAYEDLADKADLAA